MFKIDSESFPTIMDMKQDICLGKVYNLENLNTLSGGGAESTKKPIWQCEQREYQVTDEGFMKFKIQDLGVYAVIINPNPDVALPTAQECGFLC